MVLLLSLLFSGGQLKISSGRNTLENGFSISSRSEISNMLKVLFFMSVVD